MPIPHLGQGFIYENHVLPIEFVGIIFFQNSYSLCPMVCIKSNFLQKSMLTITVIMKSLLDHRGISLGQGELVL